MPLFTTYEVWKLNGDGEMVRLVKEYKTKRGAENRAEKEAKNGWGDTAYAVSKSVTETPYQNLADVPASRLGVDGIEMKNPECLFKVM